jgi:hypothetical protein
MAIVSVAIVLSFHLKRKPSELEKRMATPLGSIFWALSLASLGMGVGNYISASVPGCLAPSVTLTFPPVTVNKYSRRAAIVQTGWKTQSVSREHPRGRLLYNLEDVNWKKDTECGRLVHCRHMCHSPGHNQNQWG